MESKSGLKTIVSFGLLVLGLGLLQHAQADCSYSQLQCIEVCVDEDTPYDTCVRDCGCSSVGLLRSESAGIGERQPAKALACSYSQLQCIEICEADDTPHDTCVRDCGCSLTSLLHSQSGYGRRCRLGCSSKCKDAHKFGSGERANERCSDVCYGLCAKRVDITAATAA